VVEITDDLSCLDRGGFWTVVMTFEGDVTCVRFGQVTGSRGIALPPAGPAPRQVRQEPAWAPLTGGWSSSLDEAAYLLGVRQIRERIESGEVYQVCLCRVVSHPLADDADLASLEGLVTRGNPAPYAGRVHVPEAGLDVLSASPEAFLIRHTGRIESRPIKGTATSMSTMLAKDYAENVMIADLVRNDLSAVCRPGTVSVDALCAPQDHPGLTHLVTTVSGGLRPGVGWGTSCRRPFRPDRYRGRPSRLPYGSSQTSRRCRADRTVERSAGSMRIPGRQSLPSASVPSGPIGTPADNGG